jgi:hypothetical protein
LVPEAAEASERRRLKMARGSARRERAEEAAVRCSRQSTLRRRSAPPMLHPAALCADSGGAAGAGGALPLCATGAGRAGGAAGPEVRPARSRARRSVASLAHTSANARACAGARSASVGVLPTPRGARSGHRGEGAAARRRGGAARG